MARKSRPEVPTVAPPAHWILGAATADLAHRYHDAALTVSLTQAPTAAPPTRRSPPPPAPPPPAPRRRPPRCTPPPGRPASTPARLGAWRDLIGLVDLAEDLVDAWAHGDVGALHLHLAELQVELAALRTSPGPHELAIMAKIRAFRADGGGDG